MHVSLNKEVTEYNRPYQTTGDKFEKEASHGGAKKLSNPIENSGDDFQFSAKNKAKSDGWVHMTTGVVSCDRNRNKEGKTVANRNGH